MGCVQGGGIHTECLQEHKGPRKDSVSEAAVPRAVDSNYHHQETPLLGTSRNCQLELALNYKGQIKSTRLLSNWNPLCIPVQVTLENKETGSFYHLLSRGENQCLHAIHTEIKIYSFPIKSLLGLMCSFFSPTNVYEVPACTRHSAKV